MTAEGAILRESRERLVVMLDRIERGAAPLILPAAKLYEPIWKYDARTLANELSAHLVYGLGTATALRLLST